MIYKVLALLIIVGAVVIPLTGITILAINQSYFWFLLIFAHIWIIVKLYGLAKTISESDPISNKSGGNDTIGTAEKVVTVVMNKDGKKKIK